ncbi:MbnP family protein [Neolewinella persica]|uniref:MbnP family protein n=1 Tax=Neolewinella persica TaxID=70998 RepID=UPI00037A280A|nr:MbnP family protein [Neolewinella persica]
MNRLPLLLSAFLILLISSACYEDNIACLDADATNFDILADEACPDCCVYPSFSLDVDRIWGDTTLFTDSTYQDGAGNDFRLIRFRVYLSGLGLLATGRELPIPENQVEVGIITSTDTVLTVINTNIALLSATSSSTSSTIGRLRVGTDSLTQLRGTFGLVEEYMAVYPASAPAASPLSTQVGLLNFNDGEGYLSASAEYVLTATNDTARIDIRGLQPFTLDFTDPEAPQRGVNLTVELEADYQRIFGTIDLSAGETTVADGISAGLLDWLRVVGVR